MTNPFFVGETEHGGAYSIDRFTTTITFVDGSEQRVNTYGLITSDHDDFHQYDSLAQIQYNALDFISTGVPSGQSPASTARWANQNVTAQHVFMALMEEPAPNFLDDYGNPIETGSRSMVAGINPVTHIVHAETMTVINITLSGHMFHDGLVESGPPYEGGLVARRVIVTEEGIFVQSIGVGVGENQFLNSILGPPIFDLNTRLAIERNAYLHARNELLAEEPAEKSFFLQNRENELLAKVGEALFYLTDGTHHIDSHTGEVVDIDRFNKNHFTDTHNPDSGIFYKNPFKDEEIEATVLKKSYGGGFEWFYADGPFKGLSYQPGGDVDGDGQLTNSDRQQHNVELHERQAERARSEGRDSDARAHERSADRARDKLEKEQSAPILLDLTGAGIEIIELSQSTIFVDATGDGLVNRTAWAAEGNGVLFYDPENTGEISEQRQYVFTEWDPTATSDIEALRSVFDSNGDGVFDANDAEFANFKVMVTNADGSLTAQSLSA